MRYTLFIALFCFGFLSLLGQSAEDEVIRLKQSGEEPTEEFSSPESIPGKDLKRGDWDFSVGTSYSYMKGYGSGMMFYAAPAYTLSLNNRWALHGGVVSTRYQGFNTSLSSESLLPNSFFSFALFAAASYRMSERLVLHGAGVKQLVSTPITPYAPYPMDNISLGATYHLGNNISIGASIHMNNSRGNYSSPFGNYTFGPPIFW